MSKRVAWRQLTLPPFLFLLGACARGPSESEQRAIVAHYVATAHPVYADALSTAQALEQAVRALATQPSVDTLDTARSAWRAARLPYAQTEALRFGHWVVDEWEGQVNAWPVDEGLLDYVREPYGAAADNALARANLVAHDLLDTGALKVDTREIGTGTLKALNGLLGQEANVASGYHAIEFYLWGQDLSASGPGARPWSDYAADARCTRGPERTSARECAKRGSALIAAAQLLVSDLTGMTRQWDAGIRGSYGARLIHGDPREALRRMLFGMGALAAGELAGERIQSALLTHAQEEEQDCFSDDTHHSLYYNALGIENFYLGRYGTVTGPSVSALLVRTNSSLDLRMRSALKSTRAALQALVDAAEQRGQAFDQLIRPGNEAGAALLQRAATALEQEGRVIEDIGAELGLLPLNPAAGE